MLDRFFNLIRASFVVNCKMIIHKLLLLNGWNTTLPILLSLLYYLTHLFYLQEFLLDSHHPLHIHLSFNVLTQLNPGTVSPKREKLSYICSLSARIECEPEGEHSTHSDRVTNIE